MSIQSVNPGQDPMTLAFKIDTGNGSATSAASAGRTVTFHVPDLITHSFPSRTEGLPPNSLNIQGTPTSSTTCRVFTYSIQSDPSSLVARLLMMLANKTGLDHIFFHKIFDGDTAFINGQSRKLRAAEASGESWSSKYFMPHTSDVPISDFRR